MLRMLQKIIKVGTSGAVTIPASVMKKFRLSYGGTVETTVDDGAFIIRPNKEKASRMNKVARMTTDFVERYRKDLETLAKK